MHPAIQSTIARLKEHGRYSDSPKYNPSQIEEWQTKIGITFPADFHAVLGGGSYELENIYFQEARESNADNEVPGYIVFARWNDDLFAFRKDDLATSKAAGNPPVYVLLGREEPLKKYDSFADWFSEIARNADRPVNPE